MRRWNGWGDDHESYRVPASAKLFLEHLVGKSHKSIDARLEQALSQVPKSRLKKHPLVSFEPLIRLLHARGQSFPDWVELRSGQISTIPDGIAYPMTNEDVINLIQYARQTDCHIIPYGGGTSVVGISIR